MSAAAAFAPTTNPPRWDRRIYTAVNMSAWAWRERTKLSMLAFASRDLPRGKVRRDWKYKARAFGACGRTIAALACNNCQTVNTDSGTVVATCGLRICPICARRKAQKLRHRLSSALKKNPPGRRSSLYFLTFTMRYDPSDPAAVSASGLLERKTTLLAAWSRVWRQYLKPRGEAACRAIEVGASGMVHLHVLYLGRRPDANVLRARWTEQVGDSPIVNIRPIKRSHTQKAIVELAKYVTKGASPAKADITVGGKLGKYIDPELAVRVEIAFSGDRIVQCYGKWLGITVDDDEDTPEEVKEARELHRASCNHCGLVGEWHAQNFEIEEWIERFGPELGHWKPRIGGRGPAKPGEEDHARADERKHDERARARAELRRIERERRDGIPIWARNVSGAE